ncbi:MAG: hypothetical protein MPJ78_08975 [Hyphomicrobiaceae bacterium]|nr:hypothetical protein [Hyphomicrobiaceae bacterium]
MFRKGVLVAAVAMLIATPAFAGSCPKHMADIDAAMKTAQLSDADKAKVMQLRKQGEEQHKAGDHGASVKSLGEAKKILGLN